MKRIAYVLAIISFVLLTFDMILLVKNNDLSIEKMSLCKQLEEFSTKELELRESFISQYLVEGDSCPDLTLNTVETSKQVSLSELVGNSKGPLLFFRFKEIDCEACVQHSLKFLDKVTKDYPELKISILCGYKNVREFYAYASNRNQAFNIYNVNDIPISLEEQGNPYFFVLNKELIIRDAFVYFPKKFDLAKDYVNVIVQKVGEKSL